MFSRGVIFIGNESYALEPAPNASNGEHVLFPLASGRSDPFICGVDSEHDHRHGGSYDHSFPMDGFLRVRHACHGFFVYFQDAFRVGPLSLKWPIDLITYGV